MTTPQSDIVERLRNKDWLWTAPGALREEAADEIERLRAVIADAAARQNSVNRSE